MATKKNGGTNITGNNGWSSVPIPAVPQAVASQTGIANVEYTRQELVEVAPKYEIITDCLGGSTEVKAKEAVYLPIPNPGDMSPGNVARYRAYITRAVFYGVTASTLKGLVGQVMMKPPVVKVPKVLDAVVKDATGTGVSIEQLAYAVEALVISLGRAGLFVDYPKTDTATTLKQQQDGSIRPTITAYPPLDIINWRTKTINGKTLLSLVVLRETYTTGDDGFETKTEVQYRVLRLDKTVSVEVWRKEGTWAAKADLGYVPLDSKGAPLTEIPFTFVGALNNDPSIDPPPMFALADLNIAHYRNSADYEESVFMIGQPTPWISGLTEHWVTNVLSGVVLLGSRAAIPLPEGAAAGLLEMKENPAPLEAMKHKEEQMKALGAKLIEPGTVAQTATEASMDTASESSALHVVTTNVSAAFLWALEYAGIFAGATTTLRDAQDKDAKTIDFVLNTDFDFGSMSPEEISAAVTAWQSEAISWKEMRSALRNTGLATEDDDTVKEEIAADVIKRGEDQNEIDKGNPKFAPPEEQVPGDDEL